MPDQHSFIRTVSDTTSRSVPALRVITQALPTAGTWAALSRHVAQGQPFVHWGTAENGMFAWGRAAHLSTTGVERYAIGAQWWSQVMSRSDVDDEVGRPGTGLIGFGSFAYSPHSAVPSVMVVPDEVIGYGPDGAWRTTITPAEPPTPSASWGGPCSCVTPSTTEAGWAEPLIRALEAIAADQLRKVVLARAETRLAPLPWDDRALVSALLEQSPDTWTYAVSGLIGSTPEMLVRVRDDQVFSRVLAGTRAAQGPQDTTAHQALLKSSKDVVEHRFAVDSVVTALSETCVGVRSSATPFILGLPHVAHLASDVHAVMKADTSVLHVVDGLQPTAAVCGTPTSVADAFIAQHEPLDRGRYAGAVGWLDGAGNADWGLALRCGQICPDHPQAMTVYAGCGIVAGSTVDAEYAETVAKLRTMNRAMDRAQPLPRLA